MTACSVNHASFPDYSSAAHRISATPSSTTGIHHRHQPTPSHVAIAPHRASSTLKRVSSKVLAPAGSRASPADAASPRGVVHRAQDREMPTSLLLRPLRRGSGGPGSWEGAVSPSPRGLWQLPVSGTAPFWRRGFAGRAGTSCHFHTNLLSSSRCSRSRRLRPCPKSQGCSARSLGGRESCSPQGSRFGNALLLLFDVLTCDRLERSDGHGR